MGSFEAGKDLVRCLREKGFVAYFAGGWVRDFLLAKPSSDIDIATSATVDEILAIFPKTIPLGVAFGIVVVIHQGVHFEVATFRKDLGYADGRRPLGIASATAEEDAQRRDFTINGLFYDPLSEQLFDFVEGERDLRKGVIRAIGDPASRFGEDRLRMIRAARYSVRYQFPIETETLQAIIKEAPHLFPSVAIERVVQELKKMMVDKTLPQALLLLHKLSLFSEIFPELGSLSFLELQERVHLLKEISKTSYLMGQILPLFSSWDAALVYRLTESFKLSSEEREFALFLVKGDHLVSLPNAWQKKLELYEWAHFYAHRFSEGALEILALRLPEQERRGFLDFHETLQEQLAAPIFRIRSRSPIVKADHLLREGVQEGPCLGLLLKEAERISINQEIENPEQIILKLKETDIWKNKTI